MDNADSHAPSSQLRPSSDRTFGVVFAVALSVVALLPLLSGRQARWPALWAAGAFLVAALLVARVLHPLNSLWTMFGRAINRITNPLILGILFYGVFTPCGAIARLFGWDPLRLRPDGADSYWVKRQPPGPPPETMANQF